MSDGRCQMEDGSGEGSGGPSYYILSRRENYVWGQTLHLRQCQKWLMIARLLDALERDYQQVYHDDAPPFEEGFEESIRKWKEKKHK